MNKKIILLISLFFILTSCKTEKKETIDVNSIKIEGITLDNNKRWKANFDTTDGIKKMQNIMRSFSDKENTKAYATLKENLETEFSIIFQKCTMTGESHNQLHNYLKPMLAMFDGLESDDLKICKNSFKTMKNHLAGYVNYFE